MSDEPKTLHETNLEILQQEIRKVTTASGKTNNDIKSVDFEWMESPIFCKTAPKKIKIEFL